MISDKLVDTVGVRRHNQVGINGVARFSGIVVPYAQVKPLDAGIAEGAVEVHSDGTERIGRLVEFETIGEPGACRVEAVTGLRCAVIIGIIVEEILVCTDRITEG